MKILKYADLSLSYITCQDSQVLAVEADNDLFPLTVAVYKEGFFISLPEKDKEHQANLCKEFVEKYGLSDSFCEVFNMAIEEGADVLRLDCDGCPCDSLKEHHW